MSRNKLYTFVLIACASGFIYLFYSLLYSESSQYSVCMIKNVTGFPCPSCGITRAIQLLFKGNFIDSLVMNPFGMFVSSGMLFLPFWIVIDLLSKKQTLYTFYYKLEFVLKQKKIAIPLIILVIMNWIWNIYKGL